MTGRVLRVAAGCALIAMVALPAVWLPFSASTTEDDYPLETGLRWRYRAQGGLEVVRHVRGEREIDGRRWFEMSFNLPILGTHVVPMRRSGGDVLTTREGREHLLMRFPMRPGDRWRIDLPDEKDIADCEVIGDEEVSYLGKPGRATKLRVTRTNRKTGRVVVDHEWYARGLGLVRMEVTFGLKAVFVLDRFARGAE